MSDEGLSDVEGQARTAALPADSNLAANHGVIRPRRKRWGLAGRARLAFLLVFPGLVAVTVLMPIVTLGPIAFAIRRDFSLSIAQIGFAYTAYFLSSTFLTSVGGWLIGRHPALSIVRAGLLCSTALAIAMAFATSSTYIIVVSVLAGSINGLVTPSVNILITRMVPVRLRGLAFGIKVGAVPGASTLGALGGWAAANLNVPWQLLYCICGGIGVAVVGASFLLESEAGSEVSQFAGHGVESGAKFQRPLVLLSIGGLLGASGTAVLPPFLVDGLIDRGLVAGTATGLLAIGGCLGFMSRLIVGGLSDRWPNPISHLRAVVAMMVVSAVSMALLSFGGAESVMVAATVAAFAIGWAWPGLIHYAVIATHPESPALATSFMQTATFLGSVVGPLGFGLLAEYASFSLAWGAAGMAVMGAAILLTVAIRNLGCEGKAGRT